MGPRHDPVALKASSKGQTPTTCQRNPTTGRFERTWTPEKDAVFRELYRKMPDLELANRLHTSVDVLQHRAPKLGLHKYRLRRLPLSLQEIRDADRALNAGESLRSIASRLGTSHQVVNRAIKRWRSTHIRERAKARALELAREVPPLTTFRISDTVRREFGLIGNGTFPTPKRIRKWLNEAGLDGISRVGHSSFSVNRVLPMEA